MWGPPASAASGILAGAVRYATVANSTTEHGPINAVPVDAVREYWNSRPCNVRHSAKQVGTREYFDEVEARKYFVEPHIHSFAQFEHWSGKQVLEIGCGIGTDTMNFARCGAEVTAVELSEVSLEIAKQRASVFGLNDRIEFWNGNAEELTRFLPVREYDLVYSFGVIHHSPHPERILDQVRRYLRPGGTLKIMVYSRRSWKVLWIILKYGRGRVWNARTLIANHSEAAFGSPVTYTYTAGEVRELLREYGFRVVDLSIRHIFPWRIPDYVEHRYRKVWYFRFMPARVFQALERRFGWHLCVTAALDPRA
jgi:2-polyprenyl-3-methyl-5-hydroxy-6-metoxy-1,4-benzoquinol methylase